MTQVTDVGIKIGGVFSVFDVHWNDFTFESPKTTDSLRYNCFGGQGLIRKARTSCIPSYLKYILHSKFYQLASLDSYIEDIYKYPLLTPALPAFVL